MMIAVSGRTASPRCTACDREIDAHAAKHNLVTSYHESPPDALTGATRAIVTYSHQTCPLNTTKGEDPMPGQAPPKNDTNPATPRPTSPDKAQGADPKTKPSNANPRGR